MALLVAASALLAPVLLLLLPRDWEMQAWVVASGAGLEAREV